MNPPPPHHQLGFASSSRPVLDLNVVPMEEPMEIDPPAAPAAPRPQPPSLETTNTVQRIFREFTRRRAALISAITTDEEKLFHKCDPSLEPMHLYGHTDGSWEVSVLESRMPPRQPEPTLGINLERDNVKRVQWLQEIGKHSDAWLISVSFFAGAKLLNAYGRELLFNSMNSLQTVHEEFINSDTYHRLCRENEERSWVANDEVEEVDDKDKDDYEEVKNEDDYKEFENEEDSEEAKDGSKEAEDDNDSFCDICGDRYHKNGFWIGCDVCKGWFHGKCVKITKDQAKHVKHYVCPDCCLDNNGHDYD